MTSTSNQPQSININKNATETGFEIPLSPSEPGKFDFYRVHLTTRRNKDDSTLLDNSESSNGSTTNTLRWSPFANMKHLSDQPKTSSLTTLFSSMPKSSNDSDLKSKDDSNLKPKPIQTVASFSSLSDALKNAMSKGYLNPSVNQMQRPASGTISSKDLNHLSPQSM